MTTLSDILSGLNPFPKAEGAFFGKNSKTANLDALMDAMHMESKGKSREEILAETKWFMGPDGTWKYEEVEPKDYAEKLYKHHEENPESVNFVKLHDLINFPALKEAYPDFNPSLTYSTMTKDIPGIKVDHGKYNAMFNQMTVGSDDARKGASVIAHETQHGIQHADGGPGTGANPRRTKSLMQKRIGRGDKMPEGFRDYIQDRSIWLTELEDEITPKMLKNAMDIAVYELSPGEAEARNVQRRLKRRNHPGLMTRMLGSAAGPAKAPWKTLDVPEELIFKSDY